MLRGRALVTRLLLLQLAILVVTVGAGAAASVWQAGRALDSQYGQRSLAIAEAVATMPAVIAAFDEPDPSRVVQPIAETVRKATGATFVVVANRQQIRYAHPNPAQIGRRLSTDASTALDGEPWMGTQTGTLGRSMRAKAPIFDAAGQVIGVVSVGFLEQTIGEALHSSLLGLGVFFALALVLGTTGSLLLARHVKRQTFGLEPAEIAGLLEHRDATLHGLREGLLAADAGGRITLVNDEARRLLGLPEDCLGARVEELDLPTRLRDVLEGRDVGLDQIVLRRGRLLVLNRMPVRVRGEQVGAVVTLRDQTELDQLTRALEDARTTTDLLRAQAHEFANRMHTVAGLIELAEYDEALRFVTSESRAREAVADAVLAQIRHPALAALLLAKASVAAERGAQLAITPETDVPDDGDDPGPLVTVVGNLVDNALEALGGDGGRVEVGVLPTSEGRLITVRDSGPGLSPELAEEVFREGFTTKVARSGGTRGLGLALTRQACVRRGGWVRADGGDGGTVFTALLPALPATDARVQVAP